MGRPPKATAHPFVKMSISSDKGRIYDSNVAVNSLDKPIDKPAEPKPVDRDYDEITYYPGDGDPVRTSWNGVEFKAHIPTKVSKKHSILVPMPTSVTMADGTIQTRHVEKKIPMAELAKGNPSFMVNGEAPAERKSGTVRTPESPDEYRGYAMRWIASASEASAMDARWSAEEGLRIRCGVNDQDVAYLRPFFEARHDECRTKAA